MVRYTLLLAIAFVYFNNLGLNQVWQPNEAFYAYGAREMLRTGDFITPVYNGEIRLNKPPMTYWITALSFMIFGVNELALRLFQAVLGLGTGVLTYLIGRRLFDKRSALFSAVILLSSFLFVANSRYTSPEVILTFFTTLTLFLWLEGYSTRNNTLIVLAFVSSALGVLTKGPVGFVMPALIVFTYLLLTDRRELLRPVYYLGTLVTVLISGWWYLYQLLENGDVFVHVFFKENVKRVYGLESDPVYYYLLDVPVSFLPYSFLIYPALIWSLGRRNSVFPMVWFLSFFIVFSLVKMKLPVYILPAYPAMALLTGHFLTEAKSMAITLSLLVLGFLQITAMWAGGFLFKPDVAVLLPLSLLAVVPLVFKELRLFPAYCGVALLIFISSSLLPLVEEKRPYRDIGEEIKRIDPRRELKTYEIGKFHENLPFYADRVILRREPSEGPAILLSARVPKGCRVVKS
ncbi:MAG: glycosyltransferase family 39 protein [Aquificota bacterium]|nr:glycosyltransferase family 39 protein [Aquificota bacterium]